VSAASVLLIVLTAAVLVALGAAPVLPTVRAALLAAAICVAAIGLPGPLIAATAVTLVAAAVVDALLARGIPLVERHARDQLVRGAPSVISVAVGSVPGTVRIRQPRAAEVRVQPAEGDHRLDATLVAERRGRHTLGPVALRCTGPLGLIAWYRRVGDPLAVTVYPDVPNARRIATAVRQGRFRESGELTRGPLGLGTDFESIRDYQPDDDIRQVNWRATQRSARPMSNQYRVEQDRTVIGLIDAGRLMAAPIADRTRLDAAIDAFVAVAFVADEVGDRVGTIVFTDRIVREVAPRRRGADAVVRALFDVEPELTDAAYDLAFRSVGGGKRSLVVVATDLLDNAAASELLRAIPVLTRRHAVMVLSVTDPEIEDLATARPQRVGDVYRAAAATDLLAPRAGIVRRLEAAGAFVVEARPEHLAEAAVRSYLRAKVRARI
jgi:uncharacterized protein (DUF58 family)